MADYDLNFNDLPDTSFETPEDGIYILKNLDIIKESNEEYGTKYVATHEIAQLGRKINFDNYKLFDAKGNPETFGQGKLKKLLIATGLDTLQKINIKTLKVALEAKMFKAEIKFNDKGFGNIQYDNIYPLDHDLPALNEAIQGEQKEVTPASFEEASKDIQAELKEEDI